MLEDPTGSFEPLLDRLLAEAGPGPVLALGWRVAAGTDLEKLKARFGGRRVFNVDIHPGLNVDVLGDVHRLSRFFRAKAFSAAVSASLLEHVVAPWLVAAELNRVLAEGRRCCRSRPTTLAKTRYTRMTSAGSRPTASRSGSVRLQGSRCSSVEACTWRASSRARPASCAPRHADDAGEQLSPSSLARKTGEIHAGDGPAGPSSGRGRGIARKDPVKW